MRHIGDELAEIVRPLDPKPIPTKYQGVEFRSRLEARWAVFMDAIGVRWLYEFEGYQLGGIWYLPDFYLPDLGCWLEIKPEAPDQAASEKAARLATATRKMVYLGYGPPGNRENFGFGSESMIAYFPGEEGENGYEDQHYLFCYCPICKRVGIAFDGRGARVCDSSRCAAAWTGHADKGYTWEEPLFENASRKANGERFW